MHYVGIWCIIDIAAVRCKFNEFLSLSEILKYCRDVTSQIFKYNLFDDKQSSLLNRYRRFELISFSCGVQLTRVYVCEYKTTMLNAAVHHSDRKV